MDENKVPQSVAGYINRHQAVLEGLIKSQFSRSTVLTVLSLFLFFALYAGLIFLFRQPQNTKLASQLEESSAQLASLSKDLLGQAVLTVDPGKSTLLAAIATQHELHQQGLRELREEAAAIPPQGFGLLQLLGGTAVLALLGYLGLQRLQNIDTEIQSLREFMFRQIRERMEEGREVLKASVDQEVDGRFEKTRDDMKVAVANFESTTASARTEFGEAATRAMGDVAQVEARIRDLLNRYDWLSTEEVRSAADAVASLNSVEQAHRTASAFNLAGDAVSARLALKQITEKDLLGSADEFHNAHTEAFQMDDPQLALEIANHGLAFFPDQYDLMADKARVLISLGKASEATSLLESWRQRKPHEFARGWRPVVFYCDAVMAGELTPEAIASVEGAFSDVTQQLPYEIKPWSSFSRFLQELGRFESAEKIVRDGIRFNPYSQNLSFVLGSLLLKQGRGREAVEVLEQGIRTDYQEQFQHDVSQEAVYGTLAQAYEAIGDLEKAEACYKAVFHAAGRKARRHIREYAQNRIKFLEFATGRSPQASVEESAEPKAIGELFRRLAEAAQKDSTRGGEASQP